MTVSRSNFQGALDMFLSLDIFEIRLYTNGNVIWGYVGLRRQGAGRATCIL
jgi:hypothetical protein